MFCRRQALTGAWPAQARAYHGAWDNFLELPDGDRWRLERRIRREGSQPPREAVLRVAQLGNFHLHLGSPLQSVAERRGQAAIKTTREALAADFIILGTGFRVDPAIRPELRLIAQHIALWRDRYTPPPDDDDPSLGSYPYLGPGFEFQEKVPGAAPFLRNVHCYTPGANLSFGRLIGDIPSLQIGVPRLVAAIVRDLFFADYEYHQRRMAADVAPDFADHDYALAIADAPLAIASE
jgi:cation diffusion facilitator CzcD-associated flavoprotein CzcO